MSLFDAMQPLFRDQTCTNAPHNLQFPRKENKRQYIQQK
uniref:Uncharacterized protein n=1 Tax=Octopus bimaculoides TaxID=37653 RepID=A0A0L8HCD4_OCTBM